MTNDAAFPVFGYNHLGQPVPVAHGLTKHEYACISLKVPRTGIAEVDAVIREANRMEDIRSCMASLVFDPDGENQPDYEGTEGRWADVAAKRAIKYADAMASAREAGG